MTTTTNATTGLVDEDLVLIETQGAVGILRFNNPEELNTLHVPMMLAMEVALTALERDRNVRVIVVTGVDDRAIIAGGNVRDLNAGRGRQHYEEFSAVVYYVFRRFEACNKPTIAAVSGWAAAWNSCSPSTCA